MDIHTEKIIYFPMLVPASGRNEIMSREENQTVWKKFYTLPQNVQDIITDERLPKKIAELQDKYQLSESFVGTVSFYIRKIFFEEISLSDAETNLKNLLASKNDDGNKASAIVEFIKKEILTIKPKPKVEEAGEPEEMKPQAATVRLPLLQALSKYENLGNQLITEERIKIKSQQEPVRPSLLYWIKYYRDELGIGHHDSVQRGNFLFRSENGRRLSPEERERVNLVLKSVEENFPLEIDTVQGNIIFPVFQAPKPSVQRVVQPASAPVPTSAPLPRPVEQPVVPDDKAAFSFGGMRFGAPETPPNPGTLSFSSKHVFPGEKAMPQPLAKPAPQPVPPQAPLRPAAPAPGPKSSPFRIRPVSLGKEE